MNEPEPITFVVFPDEGEIWMNAFLHEKLETEFDGPVLQGTIGTVQGVQVIETKEQT